MEKKIELLMNKLKQNNIEAIYFKTRNELKVYLDSFIKDQDTVSVGGSRTLFELSIIDYLRNRNVKFLDRYQEGLTEEELKQIFRQSFFADIYLTSSNAITENGEIYNVDGRGNRTAAMLYGPDKVLFIIGVNKIVKDLDAAVNRVKEIAAPLNAKRLKINTPCKELNRCTECLEQSCICKKHVVITQDKPNRMYVFIVNENLGY